MKARQTHNHTLVAEKAVKQNARLPLEHLRVHILSEASERAEIVPITLKSLCN